MKQQFSANYRTQLSAIKIFRYSGMLKRVVDGQCPSFRLRQTSLSHNSPRLFHSARRPTSISSFARTKRIVHGIIAINAAVYGAWLYAEHGKKRELLKTLHENAVVSWDNIHHGRYWTIFTSAFSHRDFFHFAFNAITMNFFGEVLAAYALGPLGVVALTLGSAAVGSIAWLYHQKTPINDSSRRLPSVLSRVERSGTSRALGASGVASGMAATATCLAPFMPVYLMLVPIPVPLWIAICGFFTIDAVFLNMDSRVGHAAHMGGGMFGLLFYLGFLRNKDGIWLMARRLIFRR